MSEYIYIYEARSINVKNVLLEVFSATFSELFRCRFKSSILGALTFSASHRVWFRHGLTSSCTDAHTHIYTTCVWFYVSSFILYIHILLGKPLCRGKCTYIHAPFRGTSNSFVFFSNERIVRFVVRNGENGGYRVFFGEQMKSLEPGCFADNNGQVRLLLRYIKAIIIPYYSSLIHSLIFRILDFSRVKIANILYSLALYLLMEIETEKTFYENGRDKRGM